MVVVVVVVVAEAEAKSVFAIGRVEGLAAKIGLGRLQLRESSEAIPSQGRISYRTIWPGSPAGGSATFCIPNLVAKTHLMEPPG